MKVRILAGVVAAAILLGALFMGQIAVTVLASIVAMIAVYEFVSVVSVMEPNKESRKCLRSWHWRWVI